MNAYHSWQLTLEAISA